MRTFVFGFATGVGVTLGGLAYVIHNVDSIEEKLNEAANYTERQAVKLREKSAKAEATDDSEIVDINTVASLRWPANGTTLSPERKAEINHSSPDDPIVLTFEDIDAMDIRHVKTHVGSGRFKLHSDSTP